MKDPCQGKGNLETKDTMALKPLQAGKDPLGQFDGYDSDFLTITGGEVGTLIGIPYVYPVGSTGDKAAYDVFDGYTGITNTRPAVTRNLTSGDRPLYLLDEGTAGYGTMFGVALGGSVGQVVPNPNSPATTGGTVLGPHTAYGSGKVTCWQKPGLYAVTLNSVATDLAPTTGLATGAPLYATATGLLTSVVGSAFENFVVARFIEFTTNGSLVTTPAYLAGGSRTFTEVVIDFHPGV